MFEEGILSNICRTCNNERQEVLNIFEDKLFGNTIKIDKMLSAVSSIAISKSDSLPPHMCRNCAKRLEVTYKFLNKYKKANREINKLLKYAKRLSKSKILNNANDMQLLKVKTENENAAAEDKLNEKQIAYAPIVIDEKRTTEESGNCEEFSKMNRLDEYEEENNIKEPTVDFKYDCKICKKSYLSMKALSLHGKIIHKSQTPLVPITTELQSFGHYRTAVKEGNVQPYTMTTNYFCEQCNKTFQTSKALQLHWKISHKQLAYSTN